MSGIQDLECFIDGLKVSLDNLGEIDPIESRGFQSKIAKAISTLRVKKVAITEPIPQFTGHFTKVGMKEYLLNQLDHMQISLENTENHEKNKTQLLLKIDRLKGKLSNL